MIGNQKTIINEKIRKSTQCSWWWTNKKKKKKKRENKQHNKKRNQETKVRDSMNSEREEQSVNSSITRSVHGRSHTHTHTHILNNEKWRSWNKRVGRISYNKKNAYNNWEGQSKRMTSLNLWNFQVTGLDLVSKIYYF